MVSTRGNPGDSPLHDGLHTPVRNSNPNRFRKGFAQPRRMRLTPQPRAVNTAVATAAQTASAQSAIATTERQPTPPTTTSRSQSPHLDTESDSPTQAPESRSTSPPVTYNTRRNLRSHTRSVSPNAAVPKTTASKNQPKRKTSATSKKPAPKMAPGKKRNEPEPDTSGGEDVATSNNETAAEQGRFKRIRTGERGSISDSLEARFAEQPEVTIPAVANDSSADDDITQPTQPLKHTRSRSASRTLPAIVENNSEDAGSEDSLSDTQRPAEVNKFLGRRASLKIRPSASHEDPEELMSNDLNVRAQILKQQYGLDMPSLPRSSNGLYRSRNQIFEADNIEDDEDDIRRWLELSPPKSLTTGGRILSGRELIKELKSLPKSTPISKDRTEAGKKQGAIASSSGPSTKSLKRSSAINRPSPSPSSNTPANSSRTKTEFKLTDDRLIETVRALNDFYEHNPTCDIPTGKQMKSLLIEYHSREAINTSAASSSAQQPAPKARPEITPDHGRIDQQQLDLEPGASTSESSDDEDLEQNLEEASEVPNEITEPQTPTPQTPQQQKTPQSGGWFTKLATPFARIFSRSKSQAPTTNGASVIGDASNAHLIPKTSDFAPPATPTNPRHRGRGRPHTERRPPRSIMKSSITTGPQTERKKNKVHFTPIEQRGVLTSEEIAEIHRKQDQEQDLHARERQDRRNRMQASIEDADERNANEDVSSAQTGKKRKSRQPRPPRDPNFNWEGHFEVPYSSSSDDDDDEIEDDFEINERSSATAGSASLGFNEVAHPSPFGNSSRNIFAPLRQAHTGDISSTSYNQKSPGAILTTEAVASQKYKDLDLMKLDDYESNDVVKAMSDPELREAFGRVPAADRWAFCGRLRSNEMYRCERLGFEIPLPPGEVDPRRTMRYVSPFGPIPTYSANPFFSAASSAAPMPNLNGSSILSNSVPSGLFSGAQSATSTFNLNRSSIFSDSIPSGLFGGLSTPTLSATAPTLGGDLFGRITAPTGDPRIGTLAAGAHTEESTGPEPTSEPQTKSRKLKPVRYENSFVAPEYDSDDESNEDEVDTGNEHFDQLENAADPALQQLPPWTQTPPPKPKPSNAELPQVSLQPSKVEIAKANAEKYKPKKSSGLSHVTLMTPPHADKENRALEAEGIEAPNSIDQWKQTWHAEVEEVRSHFDPEVLAAVDAVSDEQMAEVQFRAEVSDIRTIFPFQDIVMELMDRVLP